jgi:hypothetical protein
MRAASSTTQTTGPRRHSRDCERTRMGVRRNESLHGRSQTPESRAKRGTEEADQGFIRALFFFFFLSRKSGARTMACKTLYGPPSQFVSRSECRTAPTASHSSYSFVRKRLYVSGRCLGPARYANSGPLGGGALSSRWRRRALSGSEASCWAAQKTFSPATRPTFDHGRWKMVVGCCPRRCSMHSVVTCSAGSNPVSSGVVNSPGRDVHQNVVVAHAHHAVSNAAVWSSAAWNCRRRSRRMGSRGLFL